MSPEGGSHPAIERAQDPDNETTINGRFLKELDMPQVINTNLNSLTAQRNLSSSQSSLATSMQRLSSGMRVNSAKDDAAGLAIAERMNSQVRGMNVAIRNANDGISMAQTAEGALGQIGNALQRMRELAVQARNSTNTTQDKVSLNEEFKQLQGEISRITDGTKFNGMGVLNSSTPLTFQVGANTGLEDTITAAGVDLSTGSVSSAAASAIAITGDATAIGSAISAIDSAIDVVNSNRATFGAIQNRFDSVIANLQVSVENQTAARSRIMDADFATETANMSRAQILQQAGNAMVAQANQLPQQVMSLLQG
jgi:flagellin